MDIVVKVQSPRVAALQMHMPVKVAKDTSKLLLCPMPGLIVTVVVREGDKVARGQKLATMEAMKMETTLYGDAIVPHNGHVEVPMGPGLGLEPDPAHDPAHH